MKMKRSELTSLLEKLDFPMLYETGGGKEYISANIFSYTGIYVEEFTANRDLFPGKIHPEDYVESNHKIREWHKHNEPGVLVTEFRFKTAFGEYIWIEDYLISIQHPGASKYMAGIMINVFAEKKETLELLQRIYLDDKKDEKKTEKWHSRLSELNDNKIERKETVNKLAELIRKQNLSMEELFTAFSISQSL